MNWPKRDWEATCRRIEMCLQRRCRRSALVALDSFADEFLGDDQPVSAVVDLSTARHLIRGGYHTVRELQAATDDELLAVRSIGPGRLAAIREACGGDMREP